VLAPNQVQTTAGGADVASTFASNVLNVLEPRYNHIVTLEEVQANTSFAGVMPPSSNGWKWSSFTVLLIAAALFVYELSVLDLKTIWARWKRSRAKKAREAAKAAAAEADGLDKPLADIEGEAEEEEEFPSTPPPEVTEKRWIYFGVMMMCVAGYDLYVQMPITFFNGECAAEGISYSFAGFYFSVFGILSLLVIPAAKDVVAVMSATDLQRGSIALLAVVSIPTGLVNYLGPGGFVTVSTLCRVFEGIIVGISETAVFSVLFFTFPPAEVSNAMGAMMGMRGLMTSASAPLGGVLYSAAGMAAPYLTVGLLNLATVIAAKFLLTTPTPPQPSTSTMSALLVHVKFITMVVNALLVFFAQATILSVLQPWVGVEPYNMEPDQISLLSLTNSGALILAAMTVGFALMKFCGPVICCWVGHLPVIVGCMMVGAPPTIMPGVAQTQGMAYAAIALLGFGSGIFLPASVAGLTVCLDEVGIKQKSVSAALGGYTAIVSSGALAIGPPIAEGIAAGAGGVAAAATMTWVVVLCSLLISIFVHYPLAWRFPPAEEEASAPAAAPAADELKAQ